MHHPRSQLGPTPISIGNPWGASRVWDAAAALLLLGALAFLGETSQELVEPLSQLRASPIELNPWDLPQYAAQTSLRMFAALALSLLFTFTIATWAAKSRRAERLIIPLLDILQSVPILGFISVTVTFFMSLAPGRALGLEFAAVFAIFTSQAWNMAFSFYQSLRTVPTELIEAARNFGFSGWMRFWRVEVPFAMPPLIWNMMLSMSAGWFFVVASEAIIVGHRTVDLPGIGSFIAIAIDRGDLYAIYWAIAAMLVVILLYDQLLFRPLVAWSDRFRIEQELGAIPPSSWVLTTFRRSQLLASLMAPLIATYGWLERRGARRRDAQTSHFPTLPVPERWLDTIWTILVGIAVAFAAWKAFRFIASGIGPDEALHAVVTGFATMLRVFVLIAIASVIWVPLGVWVGMRPQVAGIVSPIAQFLAAFPANLLFPVAVAGIVTFKLDPDIWLSPLMILGTQWYILFNVIAGASALPREFRDVSANLFISGWIWWRKVALPGVFPFYITGAITASGGSWNASIVAEYVEWGHTKLTATGLGSYIAEATAAGDFRRIVLGIAIMSTYVIVINRVFWRPLYEFAERRFRLA